MLKNVPTKKWQEGPCMTIFGCMVNRNFINYLLKVIAMQTDIFTHGRIQLFVVMRPSDYIKLTADSKSNLHTYSASSVLFQIFFQHELLEKYPRQAFLPWENKLRTRIKARYSQTIDVDQLYFVKIVPKRTLPVSTEHLLPLHYFVRQLFGRGTNRVLPTIEKWLPGFGKYLIVPSKKYTHYYDDISIFTMFGELNPPEILSLFQEMTEYEGYKGSAFEAMVQSELVKYETRESDNSLLLEDSLDQLDVEDLEEKFD
ncbi:dimethyladenosine transferase 2, mitochondrial isoform X2 [Atheta coriaria]